MPLPPIDPNAEELDERMEDEPIHQAPIQRSYPRAPRAPQQPVAPPPQQRPVRPVVDRLNAIKGVLHCNSLAVDVSYQMNALAQMGWEGEPEDTKNIRIQLEAAVREAHSAARRLASCAYMLQSQEERG